MSTRHSIRKRAGVAFGAAVLSASTLVVAPALADPPDNDNASGAEPIGTLPRTIEVDTREATYDAVPRRCVLGRSVWYRYTPATSGRLWITTMGSSYDTVLAVYSGARSPRERVSCNDDAVNLESAVRPMLEAGERYWIAVSACCGSPSRPGGDLVLRLSDTRPEPSVDITLDKVTAGAVSGRLRVYGDVVCATPSAVRIRIAASQRVGDAVASGDGRRRLKFCHTDPVDWVIRVDSTTGWAFQPGVAAVDLSAAGRDGFSRFPVAFAANVDVGDEPAGRVAP